MLDPNPKMSVNGAAGLERAGLRVDLAPDPDRFRRLNPGFLSRMERKRPFVRVKIAASLDGRTAMASGESKTPRRIVRAAEMQGHQ